MKRILGILAGGLLATAFALPSTPAKAAVPNIPSASALTIALIVPSKVTTSYDYYNVTVAEQGASSSDCAFYLYRFTTGPGVTGWQYLGHFSGTKTTTQISPFYFGYTDYEAFPLDCYGNEGSAVFSPPVTPTIFEVQTPYTAPDVPMVVSGTSKTVYGSTYAGGAALETTSKSAEVLWTTDCDLNQALVIGTGPQGGIGTVTVGGPGLTTVNKGTINFYSATAKGSLIAFKYGVPGPYGQYQWIKVVETKAGPTGGNAMYFNAAIEDQADDGCFN